MDRSVPTERSARRQAAPLRAEALSLISESGALRAFCERQAGETFVTVDTEFMRERTYWPKLCVVQLGGSEEAAVIDAMAPGIDLAPLGDLLANPGVAKVFHAARQDIETFLLVFGRIPAPLFDTQIAAMVAGYGDQVGYDQLVASLTGAAIDKSHRFSDWSVRPLSKAQIAYAAADVTHLRRVYERLKARLEREGRESWVAEEMGELADPRTYRNDPETMWERLKPRTANRRVLGCLRAVAAWREREAMRLDIPRGRVLKDEALLEIAATAPPSPSELARMRGVSHGFAQGKAGAALLAAIAAAKGLPEEALPEAPPARRGARARPGVLALLKVLLAAKCEMHRVAPRLVASAEEMEHFAAGDEAEVRFLSGWRREIFGADALALAGGKIALGTEGGSVRLVALDP